jgi:hypothetical protein
MKHRNLHRADESKPPEECLRLGRLAQEICAQFRALVTEAEPKASAPGEPVKINPSSVSDDYRNYLESFNVRN